jgi:hypothetical protein
VQGEARRGEPEADGGHRARPNQTSEGPRGRPGEGADEDRKQITVEEQEAREGQEEAARKAVLEEELAVALHDALFPGRILRPGLAPDRAQHGVQRVIILGSPRWVEAVFTSKTRHEFLIGLSRERA